MSAPVSIYAFTDWLAKGERGMSSESIVERLTGVPVGSRSRYAWPHDPSDFRRCELLLRAVPQAREHFHLMADVSPTWARLVDAWDELVALGEEEAPGVFDGARGGKAPRLFARMTELIDSAAAS